ncbi:MAG: amino acid adenylation domain-containing protein [Myxococcales bacterium]
MVPSTFVEMLAARSREHPDKVAFRFLNDGERQAETLTYAELEAGARRTAASLLPHVAPGERVLLLHAPGLDYISGLFGCLCAGAVVVPAMPPPSNRPITPLADLFADTGARVALSSAGIAARLQRRLDPTGSGDVRWVTPPAAEAPLAPLGNPAPNDLAVLQYTSGSTTAPKGVMLSHGTLLSNAKMLSEHLRATVDDHLVAWLPPYHDMGLIGAVLGPLYVGLEATLMAPAAFLQRPLRWLEAISRYGATISGGPNFAYDLCVRRSAAAERERLDLSKWRVAFSGAERVRPDTLARFSEAFAGSGFGRAAFSACYGLAEATLGVSFAQLDREPQVLSASEGLVSTGPPLPGLEVLIVDPETRRPLPDGEKGEIWVRGPSVALGYWNRPELTASVFGASLGSGPSDAKYLRTGDLGLRQAGEIYVAGRLKDLIILLGTNHHPEDLEAALEGCHPQLRPGGSAAFAVEGSEREELAVVVEVDSPRQAPAAEIESAVRGALASSQSLRVDRVIIVGPGAIPRTSSGKVRRAECRARLLSGALEIVAESRLESAAASADDDPERTAAVAQSMAELLGLEHVDPDADFFALGGQSLLATQLAARLREGLGIELPLRMLFESPTPRALARVLRAAPKQALSTVVESSDASTKPLSFSQERMWFLQQLDPQGAAYNVAGGLVLEGPLDEAALAAALDVLLSRHEILRSNYRSHGGRPEVVVNEAQPFSLRVHDVTLEADPQLAAEKLGSALAQRSFDLARDLLIRAELYRMGPERHALAASLHHVVGDGWSMGVLLTELLRAYAAKRSGAPLELGAAPNYLDYAAWQRSQLVPRRSAEELGYWRKQLASAPLLELPTDRPRTTQRSSAGGFEWLELPDALLERLQVVGHAHGATLFMVMLAAFDALLYRLTGTSDIVVGTPVANRTHLAAEGLVGTLVNTIALRVRFEPDQSFSSLLASVRATALDAWDHQELPFERLVSELGVARLPGRSPLFEVMFDFQNSPMPIEAAGELRLRPLKLQRGAAQFELSLLVLSTELGRIAGMEYNSALFDAATVRRFVQHYRAILEAVARDAGQAVSRIRLHGPDEERALAELSTRRTGEPFVSPSRAFERQAQAAPHELALVDEQGSLTYAEVAARVDALAARLHARGAKAGERVGILLERSSNVPIALLAVLKSGAAYVPVDPSHPDARIAHVLNDAEPRLMLSESGLAERARNLGKCPCLLIDETEATPGPVPVLTEDPGRPAYVLYTSGSTGRPKGVTVSVGALANFFASMRREPGIQSSDRLLSVTTIAFDIASLELLLPLTVGAEVHVAAAEVVMDGQRLRGLLESQPFTLLQATPSGYRLLLAAGYEGSQILTALVGGEPLDRGLAEQLLERVPRLWNMYGPTETTVWSTVHRVERTDDPIPIGRPIDRTGIYVVDRHLALAPLGVAGEICIGGAGVALGYWRRPELTAEKFVPDPFALEPSDGEPARMYRTGDVGRLRADGVIECFGRVDQQIKIRGYRVELGEIEAVLRQLSGVRDCVVICREHRPGDQRLIAYVTSTQGAVFEPDTLRSALRRALPEYMVPASFVSLEAIPLTPNGKVDRAALPAPDDTAQLAKLHVAPRTANESLVAELWSEALGRENPSVTDNFFDSGGHSLLAVRLLSELERRVGVSLPLAALLEQPTIEQLARRLADGAPERKRRVARGVGIVRRRREFSYIVPIQPHGDKPPLFCVHGAGGNVLNLRALGKRLGESRPFFGIQAAGVDGVATPFASVEQMAEAYLKELVKVQAHGPYFLSGYCGGGIVAYEMAQRLLAAGEEVALLALLDAFRPGLPLYVVPVSARLDAVAKEGPGYLWRGGKRRLLRNWRNFTTLARVLYHRWFRRAVPHELREFWLMSSFLRSSARYRPQPYPRLLTVLRARDSSFPGDVVGQDLGWAGLSQGGLELHDVPGNHDTLAHEPNVATLAETLAQCIELAEVSGASNKLLTG